MDLDHLVPISDTSLGASSSSADKESLSSTTSVTTPLDATSAPTDLEIPIKEWKRRREDAEEEEEGGFLSSLISAGRGRGLKGHKRSSSVSSIEAGGTKSGRPLPATPDEKKADGGGADEGEKKDKS